MPTTPGRRHAVQDREPTSPKGDRHTLHDRKGDQSPRFLTEDKAEHLAELMINIGSDKLIEKTNNKFTPDEVPQGPESLLVGADPELVANKIMKEAAKAMMSEQAKAHHEMAPGDMSAKAQQVYAHKDDPNHPAYVVAQKIRQRFQHVEDLAAAPNSGHMFQGVNPDAGREHKNAKMRHHAEITGHKLTAGTRHDRNPDVLK